MKPPNVHFSSNSNEWATPQDFYDKYNLEWNFTLDPCCTHENAKCAKHYTQAEDGLKQDWSGDRVWMNPPYGREIGIWMKKAYEESLKGAIVVCLVPARTDTAWWHNYAVKGEVRFIRGRLKFGGHTNSAPFPSALVILKPPNAAMENKTEREWVGGREIKRLRGIIARNARTRLSGDDGPLFVTPRDIKESLEILYAEMEREDSPNSQAEQNYETNSI